MNNKKTGGKSGSSGKSPAGHYVKRDSTTGRFTQVTVKKHGTAKSKSTHVIRDSNTGQFTSTPVDKNAQMLAATVGGAIIGNILFPGIGGAIFGGITGAIVGGSKNKEPKK